MKRAVLSLALLAAVAIGAAGCKNTVSGASAGPSPIPTSSFRAGLEYLAFGDDQTVGIGSSYCGANLATTPCQTSSTFAGVPIGTNPTGWAQVLAQYLNLPRYQPFTFVPLGVTGALSGSAPLPEAQGDLQTNSSQMAGVVTLVSAARASNLQVLITVQSGINDVLDKFYSDQCRATGGTPRGGGNASLANPCTASNTVIADASGNPRGGTLYNAYRSMISNLATLAGGPPEATVIIGVPDVGQLPAFVSFTAAQRAALSLHSVNANLAIQDAIADSSISGNIAFVKWYAYLAANPQYYTTPYFSADLFHPSDAGYAVLEAQVQQQLLASFPSLI